MRRSHGTRALAASLLPGLMALSSVVVSTAVTGTPVEPGPIAVKTTPLLEGDTQCPAGGVQIDVGTDDDLNGTLDEGEVDQTQSVCNGVDGDDGDDGLPGNNGIHGQDGRSTLVVTTTLDVGDATCAQGGVKIETGADDGLAADNSTVAGTADDGQLDAGEVESTRTVCNGVDGLAGAPGHDGLSALLDTTDAAIEDCPHGGVTVTSGIDDNRDGVLDAGEIDTTHHICNGTAGNDGAPGNDGADGADGLATLSAVTDEPAGAACPAGGQKVSVGTDDNRDGVLDDTEVDTSIYVCNGATGAPGSNGDTGPRGEPGQDGEAGAAGEQGPTGRASFTEIVPVDATDATCPAGGVLVRTGLDEDGDGELEPHEVDETATLCNGVDGVVDDNKDGLDDRVALGGGASCASSGGDASVLGLFALLGLGTLGGLRRRRR